MVAEDVGPGRILSCRRTTCCKEPNTNSLAYDLVAIDLDGTLLDSTNRVSTANRDALHRAHAAGLKVVLCTGRSFTETRSVLAQIGLDLDAAVSVFGALVSDAGSGRTLERVAMDMDVAERLTGWFRELGYPVVWLADPDTAGHDGYALHGPIRHPGYERWLEKTPCAIRCVDELPAEPAPALRISIIDEEARLRPIAAELVERFGDSLVHNVLCAPSYRLTVIEAFAPHVNKWYGIQRLCKRWGIDPLRTVAIGDDVNDLAMLRQAGLGVAMANALPEVRAVAARVTGSNNDDGVAAVIDEVLRG